MMNKEDQIQLDGWNPEEAKLDGTLKGIAEFKVDAEHTTLSIEFSDPKEKKKINSTPLKVKLGKKPNKNALF
jgi:hypothetical protein